LATFGLSSRDFGEGDGIPVWPDNWLSVRIFNALCTQWRVGMNGPTGLDYGAIPVVLQLKQIPETDWPDLFDDICVMEQAALSTMHEKE